MKISKKNNLILCLKLWIEFLAGSVVLISFLSLFSLMRLGGWLSLFCGVGWAVYRLRELQWRGWSNAMKGHGLFAVMAIFCLVSLAFGPHSFLDSFSYRIPQMLLWLQDGHPCAVPNVDMRINQMPHVWPFISTVFFLPLREWGLAVPNYISYLLLYGIMGFLAALSGTAGRKGKWILVVFMTAPVMIMQAASNDNVLTCVSLLLASLYFVLQGKPTTQTVVYSALAFALACGIKPQYITLAPLWLIWFFMDVSGARFKWSCLIWLLPVTVLCSPLPTLTVNQLVYGSFSHPDVVDHAHRATSDVIEDTANLVDEAGSFRANAIHSYISLINQMTALPVNPVAGKLTRRLEEAAEEYAVFKVFDFEHQRVYPLLIPEKASFSLLATLALVVGLACSRRAPRIYTVLAWGSFMALVAAIQLTTPDTLGRSFIGFFLLMLPLAFNGLLRLPHNVLAFWGILALLVGVFTVVLNPAKPLWPSGLLAEQIGHLGIKNQLVQYGQFSHRHESGAELIESIPLSEKIIGAIAYDGTPVVEFWKPFRLKRHVKFYSPVVSRDQLQADGVAYILIKHPDLMLPFDGFLENIGGEIEQTAYYTSYMQKGSEPWYLIKLYSADCKLKCPVWKSSAPCQNEPFFNSP